MAPLTLQVVSMDGVLLETDTGSVIMEALDGSFGIMRGHMPMAAVLAAGKVRYLQGDTWKELELRGGICEIRDDRIIILAD